MHTKKEKVGENFLTKAFRQIGLLVDEYFRREDSSKGNEHLCELCVSALRWQVINEKVTAFGTFSLKKNQEKGKFSDKFATRRERTQMLLLATRKTKGGLNCFKM